MKMTCRKIPLTQGKIALVDDEDYEYLMQWKWQAFYQQNTHSFIARRMTSKRKEGERKSIIMHRIIMNAQKGQIIDHINHDTLDNRKENLRFCTHSENMQNRTIQSNNKARYKGIYWRKSRNCWEVRVHKNCKLKRVKCVHDKIEAALVYDEFAEEVHGEFAKLNFPMYGKKWNKGCSTIPSIQGI